MSSLQKGYVPADLREQITELASRSAVDAYFREAEEVTVKSYDSVEIRNLIFFF